MYIGETFVQQLLFCTWYIYNFFSVLQKGNFCDSNLKVHGIKNTASYVLITESTIFLMTVQCTLRGRGRTHGMAQKKLSASCTELLNDVYVQVYSKWRTVSEGRGRRHAFFTRRTELGHNWELRCLDSFIYLDYYSTRIHFFYPPADGVEKHLIHVFSYASCNLRLD